MSEPPALSSPPAERPPRGQHGFLASLNSQRTGVPVRTIVVTIGLVLATLAALRLLAALQRILVLVVVAVFFAVVLAPAVDLFNRRLRLRRGLAIGLVFLLGFLLVVGLGYLFFRPLFRAGSDFVDAAPQFVANAERGKGAVGKLVRRYHLQDWVRRNVPKLRDAVQRAGGPALTVTLRLAAGVAGLVTVVVLTFLILLEAPGLIANALALLAPERARRVRRVAGDVSRSVIGYVVGNLTTSAIAGAVVYVTLLLLRVPFAFVFAMWVATVDLLPQVGGLLAGVPTVIVAALHSVSAGVTTLVVFLVYQQVENHVLNPVIMSKTVRLNPLWVFLSVLVGAELGGIPGALLAIPAAGAIQVMARDVWDNRRGQPKVEPTVANQERPAVTEDERAAAACRERPVAPG